MNAVLAQIHRAHIERRMRMCRLPAKVLEFRKPIELELPPALQIAAVPETNAVRASFVDVGNAHLMTYHCFKIGVLSSTPPIPLIIAATTRAYDLRPGDILSPKRTAKFVRPRHVAMWLTSQLTGRSMSDIGRRFGRDHTTVLHALRRIDAARLDPKLAAIIKRINADIDANWWKGSEA